MVYSFWQTSKLCLLVSLLAITIPHYSENNVSSRPNQLEHLKVDMGDDLGPNHNPRNRPNFEAKEHEYDSISRSSRITREPRSRTLTKPKMQWNENMKLVLAYIVETEKQKGRWWMRRVEKKWKDSFPMCEVLNMKNLRDMHAKLPDTIKSQAQNENFNLQALIDSELCEYEKWNRANVQSSSDCDEDNSEHQAEITTQETNEVIFGDCLEWSEEEEKLFARTIFWTNEPVTSRKSYYFKNKPTTKDIKIISRQVEHILAYKKDWNLCELNCLLYAVQELIAKSMKTESLQKKNSDHCEKVNAQNQKIVDLRRWIAWISNIVEARRKCLSLLNKQKANLRKIKRKYHVSSTSKFKEIREKLHFRLRVVSSRERKAKLSREFNRENNQFVSSQKNWFKQKENKSLGDKGGNQQNIPSMNEFETFWRRISKKPESVNKEVWTEIMTAMNKYVGISIQGDNNPNLTVKHLKRVLRKIKPWEGTGWDQLAAFWWKR